MAARLALLPILVAACAGAVEDGSDKDTRAMDSVDSGPAESADTGDTAPCLSPVPWYRDADGDGFGNPDVTVDACEQPGGFVADATDCDDRHRQAYAGAVEVPTDAVDDDCDGTMGAATLDELPLWSVAGTEDAASVGKTLATPVDFNGDGSLDLAIGGIASYYGGQLHTSTTLVFAGPLVEGQTAATADEAAAVLYAPAFTEAYIVCGLGDLDGDSYGDLAIGGPTNGPDPPEGYVRGGIVYLPRGPFAGLIDLSVGVQVFEGDALGADLGKCAGPGDMNGDGLDDVVLGSSHAQGAGAGYGYVYVLEGPAEQVAPDNADQVLRGTQLHEYVGYAVSAVGDVDGDGAPDFGVSNLLSRSADGVAAYLILDHASGVMHPRDAGVTVHSGHTEAGSPANIVVSGIGDVTGDGYVDVAFGFEWSAASDELEILAGPFGDTDELDLTTDADVQLLSSVGGPYPWMSVATGAGDWNGEGRDVLAVSDQGYTPADVWEQEDCTTAEGGCSRGAVYLVETPLHPGVHDLADEADRIEGVAYGDFLGASLAGGGDLDADGFPDLAFATPTRAVDGLEYAGMAFVLFGGGSR